MMTPFSGLSLILHLTIIGIGKVFDVFPRLRLRKGRVPYETDVIEYHLLTRAVSVTIVGTLSAFMLFFFGVAIQTSVREGAHEWQRQYAKEVWVNVQDYSEGTLARIDKSHLLHLAGLERAEAKVLTTIQGATTRLATVKY